MCRFITAPIWIWLIWLTTSTIFNTLNCLLLCTSLTSMLSICITIYQFLWWWSYFLIFSKHIKCIYSSCNWKGPISSTTSSIRNYQFIFKINRVQVYFLLKNFLLHLRNSSYFISNGRIWLDALKYKLILCLKFYKCQCCYWINEFNIRLIRKILSQKLFS